MDTTGGGIDSLSSAFFQNFLLEQADLTSHRREVVVTECACDLERAPGRSSINRSRPLTYTPGPLAEKILETRSDLEGKRASATFLYAEVPKYSSIAGQLDPEDAVRIMDGCFRVLMHQIHEREGVIDWFTSEGLLALFGMPIVHEDHAERACRAAEAAQTALRPYARAIRRAWDVDLKMRMGLNSGPVLVGSIGSDLRFEYVPIGNGTNLALMVASLARPGRILVSGETYEVVRDLFTFRSVGEVAVRGRREPITIHEMTAQRRVTGRGHPDRHRR